MNALDPDDLRRALRTRPAPALPAPDALLARAFPETGTRSDGRASAGSNHPGRTPSLVAAAVFVLASSPLWLPNQPASGAWSAGVARRGLDLSEQLIERFRD